MVENKEEIVIYNNDLNTKVYLKKFNNFNWDIFMIVVSALAFTKNGVAEISLVEIKKKTNYTSQNNENFKNKLKETNRKILQSICEVETGEDTEQFPLFKKFKIIGKKIVPQSPRQVGELSGTTSAMLDFLIFHFLAAFYTLSKASS